MARVGEKAQRVLDEEVQKATLGQGLQVVTDYLGGGEETQTGRTLQHSHELNAHRQRQTDMPDLSSFNLQRQKKVNQFLQCLRRLTHWLQLKPLHTWTVHFKPINIYAGINCLAFSNAKRHFLCVIFPL